MPLFPITPRHGTMGAMNCPKCNRKVSQQDMPDGSIVFHCNHCGWGNERLEAARAAGSAAVASEGPSLAGSAVRLMLWWVASLAVILGPYLLLRYALPMWLDDQGTHAVQAGEKLAAMLDTHYWWMIGGYLLISFTVSPRPISDYYGLFGSPTIDNPFTWEDNYNRTMATLAILLFPGKVVWHTIEQTFYLLRRLVRGDAVPS